MSIRSGRGSLPAASLDGINRLAVVLEGGEDPLPEEIVRTTLPTNIPTQAKRKSNATTWVMFVVLGTIIPGHLVGLLALIG